MMFDPFGDFETAGYLRNTLQLKDPVEVKESEHLSFELSMEDALGYLAKKKPIDYLSVLISARDFVFWVLSLGGERPNGTCATPRRFQRLSR